MHISAVIIKTTQQIIFRTLFKATKGTNMCIVFKHV